MNPNSCPRPTPGKLLTELQLEHDIQEFFSSHKGDQWRQSLANELQAKSLSPSSMVKVRAAFQEALGRCQDAWDVVHILLKYVKPWGFVNVRYHKLNRHERTLVWTASAGLPPEYEEPLRSRGLVRDCRFLPLEDRDSLWCFKLEQPTLFCLDKEAPPQLRSEARPHGIPTVRVREEQCAALRQVKGPVWVDIPIALGPRSTEDLTPEVPLANWCGKLSCNVDPDDPNRPNFRLRVMAFRQLVKLAAPYFEAFTCPHQVASAPAVKTSRKRRADTEYEATHGECELAALAPRVARLLRRYRRQAAAFDGGHTNVAMARGLVHDIRGGNPCVGTIMTDSLGVARAIPAGRRFPTVQLTGGQVRRKPGDCELLGEPACLERIRRQWRFAVAVVGASGVGGATTPLFYTYTGETYEVKSTFINLSQDLIFPIPSFKWGRIDGRAFLDTNLGHRSVRNIYLVTVFPHENRRDYPAIRNQALRFQEHLLEGTEKLRLNCPWQVEFDYMTAHFDPDRGGYPTLQSVAQETLEAASPDWCVDEQGAVPLPALHQLVNPKRRRDIRLLICVKLALQESRQLSEHEVEAPCLGHYNDDGY
jgi:hypothetical protein